VAQERLEEAPERVWRPFGTVNEHPGGNRVLVGVAAVMDDLSRRHIANWIPRRRWRPALDGRSGLRAGLER